MKKFIYVLSFPKSGTHQLTQALTSIGVVAYHEFLNITPIYLKWMKKRFTSNPVLDIEEAKTIWKDELSILLKNLEGDGYFCDISNYLATVYPIIDNVCEDMKIDMRSIHLTRNFLPLRFMTHPWNIGFFHDRCNRINDDIQCNILQIPDIYPAELSWSSDIKWEDWKVMSQFERICWYWKLYTEYFLLSKRKIFHVEDFNTKPLELLAILCPEADDKQKDIFKKNLIYDPPPPENAYPSYTLEMTDEQKDIYYQICGPILKKLGYEQ